MIKLFLILFALATQAQTQNWSWAFKLDPNIKAKAFFTEGKVAVQDLNSQKWTFLDTTGRPLGPFIYDEVMNFSQDLAAVRLNKTWFFIDHQGQVILSLGEVHKVFPFSEGFALVTKNIGQYYYIDIQGFRQNNQNYASAFSFKDGFAVVQLPPTNHEEPGIWGILYPNQEFLPLPQAQMLLLQNYGLMVYMSATPPHKRLVNRWGQEQTLPKDKQLDFIVGPDLLSLSLATDKNRHCLYHLNRGCLTDTNLDFIYFFAENLAWASQNKLYGALDLQGAWQIAPQFEQARSFSQGLAAVKTPNGLWGYVNRQGHWVIPPSFQVAFPVRDGLAQVNYQGQIGFIRLKTP